MKTLRSCAASLQGLVKVPFWVTENIRNVKCVHHQLHLRRIEKGIWSGLVSGGDVNDKRGLEMKGF